MAETDSPSSLPNLKASPSNEDGWQCAECDNTNSGKLSSCSYCSKSKLSSSSKKRKLGTEIGKVAAEKSKGLFSADDWQCNKCGNVNWARRQQCNVCNAPKFGEVEERTGFGGGYNERGVVEYKERTDSDDEYDEFGRRKKNKKTHNPQKEENEKLSKSLDDDDEEDGDEDEDLSKYDLSEWGETTEDTLNLHSASESPKKL